MGFIHTFFLRAEAVQRCHQQGCQWASNEAILWQECSSGKQWEKPPPSANYHLVRFIWQLRGSRMTGLILRGRQTQTESTVYWQIGDTQILYFVPKIAERQVRLQFWNVLLSSPTSCRAPTARHFGFSCQRPDPPNPDVQCKWTTLPLNSIPPNGRSEVFSCLRRAPLLFMTLIKERAVIGRQTRVSVKSISTCRVWKLNCGWG